MQKAGNIWGSEEEEEVSTFFQVRRGESKRGRKGERGKEAICGCLKRGAVGVSCRIPDC